MSLKSKGIFIIGAKRTLFCKLGGTLRELPASYAFAAAAKDAIRSANLNPNTIDHTAIGNVHFDILTGVAKVSLTGGTEIMSSLPYLVRNVRFGTTVGGNYQFEDYMKTEGIDSYCGKSVGTLSENLATKYGIKREEADEFALKSNLKFKTAQDNKHFKDEITSVTVTLRNKEVLVDKDSTPVNLTSEDLAKFPPSLDNGSVLTAGNSSFAADGASAILLADEASVKKLQLTPLARISGWACVGVEPEEFGLGSLVAVRTLLDDHKIRVQDVDLFEVNETYASKVLITMRELGIDPSRVNISGGAVSMGHPSAATGARLVTHLVHQFSKNKMIKRAIATSSAGGGQGVALMIEAM